MKKLLPLLAAASLAFASQILMADSLAQMLERVNAALQEVRAQPSDMLWISHAGVARCVQWLRCDQGKQGQFPTAAQWPAQAPAPGQWACYAPI